MSDHPFKGELASRHRHDAAVRKGPAILEKGGFEAAEKLPLRMDPLVRLDIFLERSWAVRHDDPTLMVQFARMALHCAQHLNPRRYGVHRVINLRCRAWAELGNAYRVHDQLDSAEYAFAQARELLAQGAHDGELENHLIEFEASLAADCRRFAIAANLLQKVQRFHRRRGDEHLVGRTLILRGLYIGYGGEPEKALDLLAKGLSSVSAERDPVVVYAAVHNQLLFLIDLARFEEAKRFRFLNNGVLNQRTGRLNEARLRWLDGRIDAGLGNFARAESVFREVKEAFKEADRAYDAALISLDFSASLLAQGKVSEAHEIAVTADKTFRGLRIEREALAAMLLLKTAFEMGHATLDLIQEVAAFLRRLDNDPKAKFEPRAW